jgi:hypothetical protein
MKPDEQGAQPEKWFTLDSKIEIFADLSLGFVSQ